MGLLARGQAALIRRQGVAAAGPLPLTYTQVGTGLTATLTGAWPATSVFQRETKNGVSLSTSERDYMIPVDGLVLNGTKVVPTKGDRITDPNVVDPVTNNPMVFEVATPNDEQVWRWSDMQRTLYRCHTRRFTR